jgi:large subunit ribosomal protein LP0
MAHQQLQSTGAKRKERKIRFFKLFDEVLRTYKSCIVVNINHVGSNQMQKTRRALRGLAQIVIGKNTLMRLVIRQAMEKYPQLEKLQSLVRGNVGLVFTNGNLAKVKELLVAEFVPASARVHQVSPVDVFVPGGNTGMDPGMTSFFQALSISTRIVKGAIDIVHDHQVLRKGQVIDSSVVALLNKLDIKPFQYRLVPTQVFDEGQVYDAQILDVSEEALVHKFLCATNKMRALQVAIRYPTELSVPIMLQNSLKTILSVATQTGFKDPTSKPLTHFLDVIERCGKDKTKESGKPEIGGTTGRATEKLKEKERLKQLEAQKLKEEEEVEEGLNVGGLFD